MSETLLSVGLDVGTTTTQLVVSRLQVENRASSLAVPELEITRREIRYRSPVYFTPLLDENRVDGEKIREIVEQEYKKAGITRQAVDTGAVIVTGETSRKENARAVTEALAHLAGDFVVATAGPELESVLAAKGAGAVEASLETEKPVLHVDIGGGTSNFCLIRGGKILDTGCFNVGGRLIRFRPDGVITSVSPVLRGGTRLQNGDWLTREQAEQLCRELTEVLEMAAGLRQPEPRLESFLTKEGKALSPALLTEPMVLSFSGGVADCIGSDPPWKEYGDLGPTLGRCIRESRLCAGEYRLGAETIRATVIGAGCHSAQLSGSTVFCQNVTFPLKNLPVVEISEVSAEEIRRALSRQEGAAVLAWKGLKSPDYPQVAAWAVEIASGLGEHPAYLCLEEDMAKALGQALALKLGRKAEILCIDRVKPGPESYLDVASPVGPALPVVVKTLILGKEGCT